MADLAYREVYAMDRVEARKRLVQTYRETGSISQTARLWHTSRQVVRKWVKRAEKGGEEALQDLSRRPRSFPRQTKSSVERLVIKAREETHYGRLRLAWYLQQQHGVKLSPYTIRHILRRSHLVPPQKKRRKPLYPASWAWETQVPFSLLQVDVKDILDKGALGPSLWDHLRKGRLPRYQWTACESRSRLRFLAYSHTRTLTNGLTFLSLVLCWLRLHGVETPVTFQTDWGEEFGGDNPQRLQALEKRFLEPLQGSLCRYPKGRKEYNCRVERSHRADDEEFYRPYLGHIQTTEQLLAAATRWVYFYNVLRPHFGHGMEGKPPLTFLRTLEEGRYNGPDTLALFPPILLDVISPGFFLACDPEGGNDLLAYYTAKRASWNRWLAHAVNDRPIR